MERVAAPFSVLTLQALLLCDVAAHSQELLHFGPASAVKWTFAAAAVTAYLCTVTTDPGFLRPTQPGPPRPPACIGLIVWLLSAIVGLFSVVHGRLSGGAAGEAKAAGRAAAVGPGADARELQPIGRSSIDAFDGLEANSDPGEETIDPADLEANAALGTVLAAASPQAQARLPGAPVLPPAGAGGSPSLGAVPGSPRPAFGFGRKRREVVGTLGGGDQGQRRAVMQSGHRLRWCKVCNMHQPLRTKHCKDCGRCVRTHDHHCPWVGTCVGEGNRLCFYWFLVAQAIELLVFLVEGLRFLYRQDSWDVAAWMARYPLLVMGLILISLLLAMVTCLLCFHSYLAMANLTTWENISWHHISYLRGLRSQEGSPFSRSLRSNVAIYCWPPWCPSEGLTNCAPPDGFKRTEDGWAIWELGEQHQPLEMKCEQFGVACMCCPCFEEG